MTKDELIAALQAMTDVPGDAVVYSWNGADYCPEATEVRWINPDPDNYAYTHYERDSDQPRLFLEVGATPEELAAREEFLRVQEENRQAEEKRQHDLKVSVAIMQANTHPARTPEAISRFIQTIHGKLSKPR